MADANIGDHEFVKKAARECNMNIVFTSVFNGSQMNDYILRQGVYKIDPNVFPDLILMDVKLDIVDSFELLELIRQTPKMCDIPLYFLTDEISDNDIRKAREFGVQEIFHKPLDRQDWTEVVTKICSAASSHRKRINR